MARRIERNPREGKNYYLVDACFLANYAIPCKQHPTTPANRPQLDCDRIKACREWWKEILSQFEADKARVYVPDICVAEAFKVLAKKYYEISPGSWWSTSDGYQKARTRLRNLVSMRHTDMKATGRKVTVHDVQSDREIIIGVDRFYEAFLKHRREETVAGISSLVPAPIHVELPDLILASTARYLMDYYDIPKKRLYIVTMDAKLIKGINECINELPTCHNPTTAAHAASKIFK